MNTAIKVNNLFKRFLIGTNERFTLFQTLRYKLSGENPLREIWALQNINFEIKKGEMVAIIGPNGSGKTTLLKILAGIIKPTFGNFNVEGNVSTIFELGLGFNPRFTALDNIYLYGALHGITKKEINKKLDAILDFAELKDFVGTKLNNFSSGMRVRLAFATVIQTVEEIILVDEVLTVGDLAFQKKCIKVFEKLLNNGHTILFVSHGIGDAKKICSKALYLDKGVQVGFGEINEIENTYESKVLNTLELKNIQFEIKSYYTENNNDKKNIFHLTLKTMLSFKNVFINSIKSLFKYLRIKRINISFFLQGFLFPFILLIIFFIINHFPFKNLKNSFSNILTKINVIIFEQNTIENALKYKNEGNYEKTIVILKKIIKSDPKNVLAYTILMETYFLKGQLNETRNIANKLIELFPENAFAYRILATIDFEENNLHLAEKMFLKALTIAKQQNNLDEIKNCYLGITKVYLKQGKKNIASKYAKEAKKLFPELIKLTDEYLIQVYYE